MLEPLYTAEEMRAVEEGQDLDLLMARAGKAVAEEAMRRFPDARTFGAVCGKGKNGGDGLVALEVLRSAGRRADEGAFRADAGYVAVAAPAESLPVLEARLLEAVKRPLEDAFAAAGRAGALALGPGLGREPERQALVRRLLLETSLPAVVGADPLFGVAPPERS